MGLIIKADVIRIGGKQVDRLVFGVVSQKLPSRSRFRPI
jgi:hypothetical protein